MVALVVISALSVLGVLFQKYNSKYYIFFTIFILALVYCFLNPSLDFDLYRHYEIYDYVRTIKWTSLFHMNQHYNTSYSALLYNIYLSSSPVYIIYIFILSRFAGHKLLIFCTTMIVYGIPMYTVYSVAKKMNLSNRNINLSIIFLIIGINYLDVSGIRNILAISLILLGMYWDLILQKRRVLSIFLYILGVFIHNSVILVVLVRLLLLIKKREWKYISIIAILVAMPIALNIYESGINFSSFGFGGKLIDTILSKLYSFMVGDGSSTKAGLISGRTYILNIVSRTIGAISVLTVCATIKKQNVQLFKQAIILLLVFMVSCITQYDLYVRLNMFIIIMSAPLVPLCFSEIQGTRTFSVKSQCIGKALIIGGCLLSNLILYYLISYRALNGLYF